MFTTALLSFFLAQGLNDVGRLSPMDDSAQLLALHEIVMDAHRKNDVKLLLRDETEDYIVAGRGEITYPTKAARRQRLGGYFGSTRFEVYRDEVKPVVRVSDDGTMGWVIVQVYVKGVQTNAEGKEQSLEFTSAWIELYEKREGRWLRTGNVSNFKN